MYINYDVYMCNKNSIFTVLCSLVPLWLCTNIPLSFSETELKGQRQQDTNLRQQSSKAGNAVTAEGLGAEEVTLAVTEAVSPNPCCFGTLDKDQQHATQTDGHGSEQQRLCWSSREGSEGRIPGWETPNSWPR